MATSDATRGELDAAMQLVESERLPMMTDDPARFREEVVRRKAAEANRDELAELVEGLRATVATLREQVAEAETRCGACIVEEGRLTAENLDLRARLSRADAERARLRAALLQSSTAIIDRTALHDPGATLARIETVIDAALAGTAAAQPVRAPEESDAEYWSVENMRKHIAWLEDRARHEYEARLSRADAERAAIRADAYRRFAAVRAELQRCIHDDHADAEHRDEAILADELARHGMLAHSPDERDRALAKPVGTAAAQPVPRGDAKATRMPPCDHDECGPVKCEQSAAQPVRAPSEERDVEAVVTARTRSGSCPRCGRTGMGSWSTCSGCGYVEATRAPSGTPVAQPPRQVRPLHDDKDPQMQALAAAVLGAAGAPPDAVLTVFEPGVVQPGVRPRLNAERARLTLPDPPPDMKARIAAALPIATEAEIRSEERKRTERDIARAARARTAALAVSRDRATASNRHAAAQCRQSDIETLEALAVMVESSDYPRLPEEETP